MRRADRLRLAAALVASALLHLGLLSRLTESQAPKMPPAPFIVGFTAEEPLEQQAGAREPLAEPAAAPKPRPLRGGRREHRQADSAVASRHPIVSASLVSTPDRQPRSALRDAASYLGEEQLKAPPRIVGEFRAIYPRAALEERRRGAVVVQLMVNADGSVAEAIAMPGAPADLAAAAVEALRYTRFTPARAGILPARARVYYEVSFVIE